MNDTIITLGDSTLQHGPDNNRVYIMQLAERDTETVLEKADSLARTHGYEKIFAKIPEKTSLEFIEKGYIKEAEIPGYYSDSDCLFLSKFLNPLRRKQSQDRNKTIDAVLATALDKEPLDELPALDSAFSIDELKAGHASEVVDIFTTVFETYPFPIHDVEYISDTMKENVRYFGCFRNGELAAVSSAEIDYKGNSAEMTDFAVKPRYRGDGIAVHLLNRMEEHLMEQGISTFFTIARSISYGMNITFSKCGYTFGGTLVNNTNISGSIESMNVWYKQKRLE